MTVFNNSSSFYLRMVVFLLIAVSIAFSLDYVQVIGSPLYDSDQGIWVMMTADPHLPDGLYYWGQNRLGSLTPLLAHLFVLIGIPATLSLTLVNIGVTLGSGYLVYRLSKSETTALFATSFLLLPWLLFNNLALVGHPYNGQLLLLLWLVYRISEIEYTSPKSKVIFGTLLLLALWVSDASLFMVPGIAYILFEKYRFNSRVWISFGLSVVLAIVVISAVKSMFKENGNLLRWIDTFPEWFSNWEAAGHMLIHGYKWSMSARIGSAALLIAIAWYLVRSKSNAVSNAVLLGALSMLLFTTLSKWVAINQPSYRYFALPLFLLMIGVLLRRPALGNFEKWAIPTLLLTSVAFHFQFSSTKATYKYRKDKSKPTRIEVEAITNQIQYPLFGDYWVVYAVGGLNENLVVSPNSTFDNRTPWTREELLKSDTIQIVQKELHEEYIINGDTYARDSEIHRHGLFELATYTRE